jgi:hypothetical protein
MELTGISFPNNTGDDLILILTDLAMDRVGYFDFTDGDPIDITDAYPLMQHYYKIQFATDQMLPVEFVITNPDATEVTACCMEFIPSDGLTWAGAEYSISTTRCSTT